MTDEFVDLGEPSELPPTRPTRRRKYYPSIFLHRAVKGLPGMGQTAEVKAKIRVTGMHLNAGESPRHTLEVQGMSFSRRKEALKRRRK